MSSLSSYRSSDLRQPDGITRKAPHGIAFVDTDPIEHTNNHAQMTQHLSVRVQV
jgi:hypothetical protein